MRLPMRSTALVVFLALTVVSTACSGDGQGGGVKPVELVKPTPTVPFDRTFTWRPLDTATTYRVVVFNSAGERSFEVRDVKGTSVALSQSLALPPGEYAWQVVAFRNDQQLSESARTSFSIK